ncbi:hypothetical protein, partial [Stieleria sedimenti]|uniref:hypothetical protein n=1 Tax=Stieleria sedimenti TaxID=2976331 RepID=UPI00217FFB3D
MAANTNVDISRFVVGGEVGWTKRRCQSDHGEVEKTFQHSISVRLARWTWFTGTTRLAGCRF